MIYFKEGATKRVAPQFLSQLRPGKFLLQKQEVEIRLVLISVMILAHNLRQTYNRTIATIGDLARRHYFFLQVSITWRSKIDAYKIK